MSVPEFGYVHNPAYDTGYLPVGDVHKLYYQQFGHKDGKPVIFLHGGPGGSCTLHKSTYFFNPALYRLICLDQRGAGRSMPLGSLHDNTPTHLVSDIESLRTHLQIPKWHMVFGGSWGSALSLLYAQAHPSRCGSLVLRGVYMETTEEHAFSRGKQGAGRIRPQEYDEWVGWLPEEERGRPLEGWLRELTCGDGEREMRAAERYHGWGDVIGTLRGNSSKGKWEDLDEEEKKKRWAHARLEAWHHVKFVRENYEFFLAKEKMNRVKGIPCSIVHGRYDLFCTPRVAWELHKRWDGSRLFWVDDAGHSAHEPGIAEKLTEVCDEYAKENFA